MTSSGNDAELDSLLIRFHIETAARRGATLTLRIKDLDTRQHLARPREKNQSIRWQPHRSHRRG